MRYFVGLDWGGTEHAVWVVDEGGRDVLRRLALRRDLRDQGALAGRHLEGPKRRYPAPDLAPRGDGAAHPHHSGRTCCARRQAGAGHGAYAHGKPRLALHPLPDGRKARTLAVFSKGRSDCTWSSSWDRARASGQCSGQTSAVGTERIGHSGRH